MSNSVLDNCDGHNRQRYDYEGNHLLEQFSSRCRNYHHNQCSGKVSRKRNPTSICPCYCHNEVKSR